ncbi:DgyrCDS5967 [Dimorphilus gyrociliatus]|uniref:DgyrCDS5967 n=1 Tax=Dimorphilus gyrociliatus TaxID=2664684 RepID=A0A7I8VLJ5_9ANNE|nr:DgyrCDS5967 [Dimorphilus gyrociliatus]
MVEKEIKLQRRYGILHGVGVISGLVFGSGIYVAPTGILRQVNSGALALIIWLVSGILSFVGALCYAELGANAVKCLTFAKYVLEPIFDCGDVPMMADMFLAIIFCWFLVIINCFYVKWSARTQTSFTICGIIALLSIIITAVVHVSSEGKLNDPNFGLDKATVSAEKIVLAFYSTFWAYGGYQALNFIVDEIEKPKRNLPIAIGISAIISIVFYISINFAFIAVLGSETVANTVAVGSLFAKKMWGPLWFLISICISINLAGSFNSGLVIASRLTFIAGKKGDFGSAMSLVSIKYLSPVVAILTEGIVITLAILVRDIYLILNLSVFFNQASEALVFLGLIIWRFKKPTMDRPIKLPLPLLIFFVALLFLLLIVTAYSKPLHTVLGLAIFVSTGLGYYFIFVSWKNKPKSYLKLRHTVTVFLQKLFYAANEDTDDS